MRWLAILAVVAVALAACSPDEERADPAPSSLAATTATTAPACAPAPPTGRAHSLESSGGERTYLLDLPEGYDGRQEVPVVLNFHGFGSNAEEQALYSGLGAAGTARGYAVVTPQGLGDPARWVFLPPPAGGVDDVVFAADLLDHLEETLCVDRERQYSTGMSNGAALTARLACMLGDRLAAVATVTANFYSPDCLRTSPVSLISFHGTADVVVPYEGGPIAGSAAIVAGGRPVPPEEESMQAWAHHSGCDAGPVEDEAAEDVRRLRWEGCDAGADVVLYAVEGGGHTWPGAVDVATLGPTTDSISATDLILDFFDAHPGA